MKVTFSILFYFLMFKSYWKMDHIQMYDKHCPHRSALLFTSVAYVRVLTQQDGEISAAWLFDSVSQLWVVDEASSGSGSSSMNTTPCSMRGLLRLWGTTQKHRSNFFIFPYLGARKASYHHKMLKRDCALPPPTPINKSEHTGQITRCMDWWEALYVFQWDVALSLVTVFILVLTWLFFSTDIELADTTD